MANAMENMEERNLTMRICTIISDETGVSYEMVGQIYHSVAKRHAKDIPVTTQNAAQFVIQDLINNGNGPVRQILTYNGVKSSVDIGLVIQKLCEACLLKQEESDNFQDFAGQFESEAIDQFISKHRLRKAIDWRGTFLHGLYIGGALILVLAVTGTIPDNFAGFGGVCAFLGWFFLNYGKKLAYLMPKLLSR